MVSDNALTTCLPSAPVSCSAVTDQGSVDQDFVDRSFGKNHRLLTSAQFQQVFDNTDMRAGDPCFLLLAHRQSSPSAGRLGFVVSRKNVRRAVDRNQLKRIARESFRHHKPQLQGLDIILLAKKGVQQLPATELRQRIDQAWLTLLRRLQKRQTQTNAENR